MHWKAEEASEAEAEFETERRGGRGFPLQGQATEMFSTLQSPQIPVDSKGLLGINIFYFI